MKTEAAYRLPWHTPQLRRLMISVNTQTPSLKSASTEDLELKGAPGIRIAG